MQILAGLHGEFRPGRETEPTRQGHCRVSFNTEVAMRRRKAGFQVSEVGGSVAAGLRATTKTFLPRRPEVARSICLLRGKMYLS